MNIPSYFDRRRKLPLSLHLYSTSLLALHPNQTVEQRRWLYPSLDVGLLVFLGDFGAGRG